MADEPSYTFSFIGSDLVKQIDSSRTILLEVQKLKALAGKETDPGKKLQLEQSIATLLRVADTLTANVEHTTSQASATIGALTTSGTLGKKS